MIARLDAPEPVATNVPVGATGTAFPGAFGATISCVHCGRHMPRSRLESVMLAGSRHFRCRGGCETAPGR